MPANPIIQNIRGLPTGPISIDTKLSILAEIMNSGEEGDAYLSVFCNSASYTGIPPYEMGTRLKNWKPALSGQMLIYSGIHGLTPESDPAGLGLCGGCHADGDCWPYPAGQTTLRFETGYLTPDPVTGYGITTPTDSVAFTFSVGEEGGGLGISWPMVAIIGAAGVGLILLAKKK